jgi:hypothetical protein
VAKKSRTPPPPRPVQAPKVRHDSKERTPRSSRLILAIVAGVVVLALAVGGIVWAATRGDEGAAASGICEVTSYPGQGQQHSPPYEIPDDFEYNSYPPTTGPHNPTPAVFGEYPDPVPAENYLHNQEHGGVTIQYGSRVPDDVVQRLTAWYRVDPRGLILAPLPQGGKATSLQDRIVMTAWTADREDSNDPTSRITKQEGHLAVCTDFDEGSFDAFLSDYRAKGPEPFTLDQLMPGGN